MKTVYFLLVGFVLVTWGCDGVSQPQEGKIGQSLVDSLEPQSGSPVTEGEESSREESDLLVDPVNSIDNIVQQLTSAIRTGLPDCESVVEEVTCIVNGRIEEYQDAELRIKEGRNGISSRSRSQVREHMRVTIGVSFHSIWEVKKEFQKQCTGDEWRELQGVLSGLRKHI